MFENFRVLPSSTFLSFNKIPLKVSIFFRLSCETVLFLVFFYNFTRESGERLSKIDPLVHARRSDCCVTLGKPNEQGFKR